MFKNAIVCPPGATFSQGLTTAALGSPDLLLALQQHQAYCQALQRRGLTITLLEPDDLYPDSTFVEDTAVVTGRCAILTHPGAPSRRGEVAAIRQALQHFYPHLYAVEPPGTLDGGDICQAEEHFFIGLSQRTNAAGAWQLAEILSSEGYTSSIIDVRQAQGILHLKSGLAYLGEGNLLVVPTLQNLPEFAGFHISVVPEDETYAANCLRVNDALLMANGYPQLRVMCEKLGYPVISLDVSEFAKMDGGLSCLSLRF